MRSLFVFFLSLICNLAFAQSYYQSQKVVNDDRDPGDFFGESVAISGDWAIVGAYVEEHDENDTNKINDAGSVYFFKYNGTKWVQHQKVVPAVRSGNAWFGLRVDIDGTTAVVGAPFEGKDSFGVNVAGGGVACVFEYNSSTDKWEQTALLAAPIRKASDYFGHDVAVSGDYIVCGAYFEDEDENEMNTTPSTGSAYIFKKTTHWVFHQKIVASDRTLNDRFGESVAIHGDYLIVGAIWADIDSASMGTVKGNAGAAYLFKNDGSGTWTEVTKIVAHDPETSDFFGNDVAISDSIALIGSYKSGFDKNTANFLSEAGAAYLINLSNPGVTGQKLTPIQRAGVDEFGRRLEVNGTDIIIGAHRHDRDPKGLNYFADAGAAYLFQYNADSGKWVQTQMLVRDSAERNTLDQFGRAVAISDDFILCTADLEDLDENLMNSVPDAGAAYFFSNKDTTTSISHIHYEPFGMEVYPNPAGDYVILDFDIPFNGRKVSVYNYAGMEILNITTSEVSIRLNLDLNSGLYLIQVEQDELVTTRKLIVR